MTTAWFTPRNMVVAALLIFLALVPVYSALTGNAFMMTLFTRILILAFVVIIIGGIGSIRGAFVAAILVGIIDTIGRAFLPDLVRYFLSYSAGSSAGPALSSMLIYTLMALVLIFRPEGLFPATSK